MGVSWGGWPIGVSTLRVFGSGDCSGAAFTSWSAPQDGGAQGPGSCVDVRGYNESVGSVTSVF